MKKKFENMPGEVREFITKKVKSLRSIKKTKEFYNKDDLVSEFAHQEAKRLFSKKSKKKKNKRSSQ